MLPDTHTHALHWHMHTKRIVLGYLQATSVNWSGGLRGLRWKRNESPQYWHVCICAAAGNAVYKGEHRASFWTGDLLYPLCIISGRHSSERKNAKLFLHCLFLKRLEGAFVICINLGFKHTWKTEKTNTNNVPKWILCSSETLHQFTCDQQISRDFWDRHFPPLTHSPGPHPWAWGLLLMWLLCSQPHKSKPQRLNIEPWLITRRVSFSYWLWMMYDATKSGDSANRGSVLVLFSHIKKNLYSPSHHLNQHPKVLYVKSERLNIIGKLSRLHSNKIAHMTWAVILSFCDVLKWERPLKWCVLQTLVIHWFSSLNSSVLLMRAVMTCSLYDNWFLREKSKLDSPQNFARYANHLNASSVCIFRQNCANMKPDCRKMWL